MADQSVQSMSHLCNLPSLLSLVLYECEEAQKTSLEHVIFEILTAELKLCSASS